MYFIKKHHTFIAWVAVLSFFYLIQINSFPLRAETASPQPQQPGVSSATEQPGTIEQPKSAGYTAKKKSPLIPIIIGVVVVGAVAAVLILVVFKTKYDITGIWNVTYVFEGDSYGPYPTVFTGDKKSGTVVINNFSTGPYTVDGKKVSFHTTADTRRWEFSGEFTTKTHMGGVAKFYDENILYYTGTWSADKTTTAAAIIPKTGQRDLAEQR